MINENERLRSQDDPEKTKAEEYAKVLELLTDYSGIPAPESKREGGMEVLELEALITAYDLEHPVEELYSITTAQEAIVSPLRKRAKDGLIPILKKLQILKKETDILPDKLVDLALEYKRFSSAVGMVNSGEVHHEVID